MPASGDMTEADTRQAKPKRRIGRHPPRLIPRRRRWRPDERQRAERGRSETLARLRLRRRARRGPRQPSLLSQEPFRLYWITRLLTQTAQGALIYALLIIVVDETDASFYNSLFVICAIIPSLAFGLPAGIVVDALPRRPMMVTLNGLRFVFALSLIQREPSLPGIFAATLGIWTIHQFYSPAESTLMATLVPRQRLPAAQALSNLALTLAQLFGLVIMAPLLLKTVGPPTLFALCAMFFMSGALILILLRPADERLERLRTPRAAGSSLRETLFNGWHASRHDSVVYEVMIDDILVGIGASALLVITPLYLKGVLETGAENTVFVFAPAALGLVLGLRLAPQIDAAVGERRAATLGLMLFAACVGCLGFVDPLRDLLNHTLKIPTDRVAELVNVPPLILIVMLLSIPAGVASSVVSVSARSVLLGRTPPALRGQVIATQSL